MESVSVDLTDEGELKLTVDGVTYPPLSTDAVDALAARLAEAKVVVVRLETITRLRTLIRALAASGDNLSGTMTITSTTLVAEIDAAAFARARRSFGLANDPVSTEFVMGGMTVRRKPA